MNPFKRAAENKKYVKLLLYGAAGIGKTSIALQFPKPCVMDLESGTNLYDKKFAFDVFAPTTTKQLNEAVSYLLQGGAKDYETLVIDPITVAWETLQFEWQEIFLKRNKGLAGDKEEFYQMQPADWAQLKGRWKDLMRDLIALNLHVICIAREKALYADNGFMKKIGSTFDSEKSLDYWFDSVVQLSWNGKKRMAQTIKDRSEKLPAVGQQFELSFSPFAKLLGRSEAQERPALENELRTDLAWMDDKVPNQTSTWRELGENFDAKNRKGEFVKGRQYLHQIEKYERYDEKTRAKARIALEICKEQMQEAAKEAVPAGN